ncbi:MAG TPA: glycosyltransferase [Blastococcus sp.]
MTPAMDPTRRPVMLVSLPESGLLNPLTVLAGELARRGVEDILFATDEPRRAEIESLSAVSKVEFVSLGGVVPEMSAVTWDDRTYDAVMRQPPGKAFRALLRLSFSPASYAAKYRSFEAVVAEHRPALLVLDVMCEFAIDVAITKGIPYVLSSPFLPSNLLSASAPFARSYTPRSYPTPRTGLPHRMTLRQKIANRTFLVNTTVRAFLGREMTRRLKEYKRVRTELGVSPKANVGLSRVDHAVGVLCYSVPEIDYPFPIPSTVHLVGAMVPPLPQAVDGGAVKDWLDEQTSVVYQAFGTLTRLDADEVRAFVEVARRLAERGHQVLWKLPEEQQRHLPPEGELPRNLRIESWLPSQLDVLAHPNVTVFFNHCGSNGFHEGLYFGKPQVMRPLFVDCHDQAIRGQDAGVGLPVHSTGVDTDDVTEKLLRVLSEPRFLERAEHFAALLRAAGGRRAAADVIENLLPLARRP